MIARKEQSDYNKQMAGFREVYQKSNISKELLLDQILMEQHYLRKNEIIKIPRKRYEREKENFTEIPDVEEAITIKNAVTKEIPSGKMVLDISLPTLTQGDKELSRNINLSIFGSKHVVIIGHNGVGKTTFLKKVYEELKQEKTYKLAICHKIMMNY